VSRIAFSFEKDDDHGFFQSAFESKLPDVDMRRKNNVGVVSAIYACHHRYYGHATDFGNFGPLKC
jgi:hypothetical protein